MTSLQIARKARLSPSQYQQALLGLMNIYAEYRHDKAVRRVVLMAGFMLKHGIKAPGKYNTEFRRDSSYTYDWGLVLSARDLIVALLDD